MSRSRQKLLSLIVSVCLLMTQALAIVPVSAAASLAGNMPLSMSGSHHDHGGMQAGTADHADHSGCATHTQCGGLCCTACAHCASTMVWPLQAFQRPQPVQSPVVLTLRLSHLTPTLSRPPKG